ncbi:RNA-binding protein 25-like protein [Anopheles sinensis]|uniref:RNA-binding protein 25-like protein n=1 Tax=Anopheles sinensis TaxID=74873 RepID=A0A084VYS6_ANOSI|nr:RNA-binding protein 25-like protein [Anopheles sinensis]
MDTCLSVYLGGCGNVVTWFGSRWKDPANPVGAIRLASNNALGEKNRVVRNLVSTDGGIDQMMESVSSV